MYHVERVEEVRGEGLEAVVGVEVQVVGEGGGGWELVRGDVEAVDLDVRREGRGCFQAPDPELGTQHWMLDHGGRSVYLRCAGDDVGDAEIGILLGDARME